MDVNYSYLLKNNVSVIKNRKLFPLQDFKHQIEQFHRKQKRTNLKSIHKLISEINKDGTKCNWNLKQLASDFVTKKPKKLTKSLSMVNITKPNELNLPLISPISPNSEVSSKIKEKTVNKNISTKSIIDSASPLETGKPKVSNNKLTAKSFRSGLKITNNFVLSKIGNQCPIEKTLLGPQEKPENYTSVLQDTYLTKPVWYSKDLGKISLFGLFDGHGLHGHIISKVTRDFFWNYFEKADNISETKDNFYTIWVEAYKNASNNLLWNYQKYSELSGTSALLLWYPHNGSNKIYCANSGDSKCIWYSAQKAIPLSADQSPNILSEKERIVKSGGDIETEESMEYAIAAISRVYLKHKNFPGICVSRSLGDFVAEEIGIIAEPEITHFNVTKDEAKYIVIATESVWKYLSYETIGETVKKYYARDDIFGASKEIEEKARNQWKKHFKGGEIDDISVMIIFWGWGR